jgi:hypothetical protein
VEAQEQKGGKSGTVGQMSFVFNIKISVEAFGLTHLRNILDKVIWSLKARPHNPMGKLIWDYFQKNEVPICNYVINQQHNECENIHSWISLSGDLAFSHQDRIYSFKFPKRFLEISSRDLTSLFSILII